MFQLAKAPNLIFVYDVFVGTCHNRYLMSRKATLLAAVHQADTLSQDSCFLAIPAWLCGRHPAVPAVRTRKPAMFHATAVLQLRGISAECT